MIISASYRSDIPAFYAKWFKRRLDEGYALVTNPYSGKAHQVSLRPDRASAFVFWTRNPGPFLEVLDRLAEDGRPFYLQFTITGYPRALENSVIDWKHSLRLFTEVARRFGPQAAVWRYDPLIDSSLTPVIWHRQQFARLAEALAASTNEVVLSVAQIYAKTNRNLTKSARRQGFSWRDPSDREKQDLLQGLAEIALANDLAPRLCAQPHLLAPPLQAARCVDLERLSRIAGRPILGRTKGNREGCFCAESRDIGAYDSCPHGCVYCYAVRKPEIAKQRYRQHDPDHAAIAL